MIPSFTARDALWFTVLVLTIFGLDRCSAGREAKYAEREKVEALAHTADSLASVKREELAILARRIADSTERALALTKQQVRAAAGHTDSVKAVLRSVRDSALAVAADSGATSQALRGEIRKLAAASDSAERAHTLERVAWVKDSTATAKTIRDKNAAIQAGVEAENAALKRATSSEAQVKTFQDEKGGYLRRHLVVGVGAGVTLVNGKIEVGPALVAGLKIW